MCFPACMDKPWGLCSHLCPGGGRVRGKPDLDHFGKGEEGEGGGYLNLLLTASLLITPNM